jgi:hypothetical protein
VAKANGFIQSATHSILELFVKARTKPVLPAEILQKQPSGFVPWPEDWTDRRGVCDFLVGPCVCGAFHGKHELWVQEKLTQHQAVILE